MKLKKGDEIIISSGKDKGKKGKIEKVSSKTDTILVPGINMFKRHMKKRDERNPGGIIEFARPINASKVALVCNSCGKPTRIGYKITGDTKVRICKKCNATL
jgi:large subunit ribosomal protein L24